MTPRDSARNSPRILRAILRAQFSAQSADAPPTGRARLRRVPPPPRDHRPRGADGPPRTNAQMLHEVPKRLHAYDIEGMKKTWGPAAYGTGGLDKKAGAPKAAAPKAEGNRAPHRRAAPAAAPAAAAPAAARRRRRRPRRRRACRRAEARAAARVHNTLDLARASAAGVHGRRRQKTPARVVVGARIGSLPYATSPPVAIKPPSKYEGAAAVAVEWAPRRTSRPARHSRRRSRRCATRRT